MEFRDELSSSGTPHDLPLNLATSFPANNVKTTTMQKRKAGRKKFRETRHPIYKGVRRRNGKWVCELRQPHNKSRIWLGTFSSPDMAARAHDAAAWALRRDSAALNFPETAYLLPQARSTSIRDIQCAALEAAENMSSADHHFDQSEYSVSPSSSSSMTCVDAGEEKDGEASRKLFLDEEELFNMPALINSMAEGLILTPPALKRGFKWDHEDEDSVDLTLWSD